MNTSTVGAENVNLADHERIPFLDFSRILAMNVGFFGVQFSFGLTQSAISPLFLAMGANGEELPILNLAGPMTGLLIQPLIGAWSDKTWHPRWGRRRPFIIGGMLLCLATLIAFPFITALWMGVLCLWLLDAGNNTSMEPYRALISDRLPKSQLARGFLVQSMFTGGGAVLANLSLFFFQRTMPGEAANGVPYWAYVIFGVGAVCMVTTVMFSMLSVKEITPPKEELDALKHHRVTPWGMVYELWTAVKEMPLAMHKIGFVFMFQWYAMFIYWQFVSVSLAETVYGVGPHDPEFQQAAGLGGLVNGAYNFFTMVTSLFLLHFVVKYGGKRVHAFCLALAAASLVWLTTIKSEYMTILPMVGFGICWASMVGVPYLMVASMVPRERNGVYMGILNMMIVVPMLIQTLTFGWIFENLLDSRGSNALLLAAALLGCAAIAMLWVNNPNESDDSAIVPLAAPRELTIYNRVIVGSDGGPSSIYGVQRAMGVADAAAAKLVVVTAYDKDAAGKSGTDGDGHVYLSGEEAGREALRATVEELNRNRIRSFETRLVAGGPAEALLEVAGNDPASVIVVGNRALGAAKGQSLGVIPSKVVANAQCDVIVVQNDEMYAAKPV